MTGMDYYQWLGVAPDASGDEIKKAYRAQALQYHPDNCPEDPQTAQHRFHLVQEAYETLRDSERRRQYDLQRQVNSRNHAALRIMGMWIDREQAFKAVRRGISGTLRFVNRLAVEHGIATNETAEHPETNDVQNFND